MPAPIWLKPRRSATIEPPINEPNIGMRLNTPVMSPNGSAKPGFSLKMRLRIKTVTIVAHALMRATVMALET